MEQGIDVVLYSWVGVWKWDKRMRLEALEGCVLVMRYLLSLTLCFVLHLRGTDTVGVTNIQRNAVVSVCGLLVSVWLSMRVCYHYTQKCRTKTPKCRIEHACG